MGKFRVPMLMRPSLLGFFLGSTLSGAGVYYYVLEEYKVSNELLTTDIYVSSPDLLIVYIIPGNAERPVNLRT